MFFHLLILVSSISPEILFRVSKDGKNLIASVDVDSRSDSDSAATCGSKGTCTIQDIQAKVLIG